MEDKYNLILTFYTALYDCFRDEEQRELDAMPPIDFDENANANELILSMFYAMQMFVNNFSGNEYDPLEFISVLTRLIFIKAHEDDLKAEQAEKTEV